MPVPIKTDTKILQSILDSLHMGIYVLDHERRIRWTNSRGQLSLKKGDAPSSSGKYCYEEIFGSL